MTVEFDPPRPGADGKPRERKARLVRERAKAEGNGLDAASGAQRPKFPLIPFNKITFATTEEWLVKKLLPRKGVGECKLIELGACKLQIARMVPTSEDESEVAA